MQRFPQIALIGVGGSLGALARLGMANFGDPAVVGTFVANIAGSAALGLLAHQPRTDRLRWFAATGFCGGLTTMSTFAVELVTGLSVAPVWIVVAYGLLSVGIGLAAFSSTRKLGPQHPAAGAVLVLTALAALIGLIAGIADLPGRGLGVAIAFVLAAAVGASLRGLLSAAGTFNGRLVAIGLINVVGAFSLAALSGLPDPELFPGGSGGLLTSPNDQLFVVGLGGLGAFTTFSTAISQLERIAREHGRQVSVLAGVVMFVAILAATALGRAF